MKMLSRRSSVVLALSVVFALSVCVQPALAGKGGGTHCTVTGYEVQGTVVMVDVANGGSQGETVQVLVDAKVGETAVRGIAYVYISGRGGARVAVGFLGPVTEVTTARIVVDDGTPY